MNNARPPKQQTDEPQMPLEEIARRMLAMPVQQRSDMPKKKAAKKRAKKASK